MSRKVVTAVLAHIKATSYVDEQVDKFDAFGLVWNGAEAIHLTFGRNTMHVKNTHFYEVDGVQGVESGDSEVVRLDVAGLTLPIEVAKELAATLANMIAHAEKRQAGDEKQ